MRCDVTTLRTPTQQKQSALFFYFFLFFRQHICHQTTTTVQFHDESYHIRTWTRCALLSCLVCTIWYDKNTKHTSIRSRLFLCNNHQIDQIDKRNKKKLDKKKYYAALKTCNRRPGRQGLLQKKKKRILSIVNLYRCLPSASYPPHHKITNYK